MNSAINPTPKNDRYWIDQDRLEVQNTAINYWPEGPAAWYTKEGAQRQPDVVFIGDSLIEYMTVTQIWDDYFRDFNAVNFGIGGDRTEHVLWRIMDGEIDGITPKGIPPKGHTPNKYRDQISQINKGLSDQVSTVPYCIFQPVDPGLFIDKDGLIDDLDMYDYLHLTSSGYRKICDPLKRTIESLLQTPLLPPQNDR